MPPYFRQLYLLFEKHFTSLNKAYWGRGVENPRIIDHGIRRK
jgi:hypothetical protein